MSVESRDVAIDELDVGDVIVIDRTVGEIETRTFATVVEIGARGPRIVGPSYPVATYANALKIDGETEYKRIVGRDGRGCYHLIRRDRNGIDVLDVVDAPGADPDHAQAIPDDETLGRWIRHVGTRRGWETLSQQSVSALEGGDSA